MANVVIGEYVEPEKINPYAEHVAALIEAGEGKAATVTVPTKDAKKTRFKFSKAANDADRTARVRQERDNGDGTTSLTFTLTAKHKPRIRKAKEEAKTSKVASK